MLQSDSHHKSYALKIIELLSVHTAVEKLFFNVAFATWKKFVSLNT